MDEEQQSIDRFKTARTEHLQFVYDHSGQWARHMHALMWAVEAFGISIVLGGLLYYKDSRPIEFTAAGSVCLVLLFLTHRVVEANKLHVKSFWKVVNTIEVIWNVRDPKSNTKGPLVPMKGLEDSPGSRARYWLVYATVACMLAAIVAKWAIS